MQITKYISIPKLNHGSSSSRHSSNNMHPYVSYIYLVMSMLTGTHMYVYRLGIMLICFTTINQYLVTSSQFDIGYIFGILVVFKALVPINYLCKHIYQKNSRKNNESKRAISAV